MCSPGLRIQVNLDISDAGDRIARRISAGKYILLFWDHSRCSCRCSICVVFDPCAASVSTTGQPDGLSVGDGVQYRVDRACDGNLYYGKERVYPT